MEAVKAEFAKLKLEEKESWAQEVDDKQYIMSIFQEMANDKRQVSFAPSVGEVNAQMPLDRLKAIAGRRAKNKAPKWQ